MKKIRDIDDVVLSENRKRFLLWIKQGLDLPGLEKILDKKSEPWTIHGLLYLLVHLRERDNRKEFNIYIDDKNPNNTGERLLIGWREILPALSVADKRTAKKILSTLGLLRYDKNRPVLFLSKYTNKLKLPRR